MNTFTTDTWNGKMNPKTKDIEDRARESLAKVTEQFIRDCINNEIEVSSAEGFFYTLTFQSLVESRAKVVTELKNKKLKPGDRVWFLGYQTHKVIKAEVTGKADTVVTLRGISKGHENERFNRHIDELFMTEESAREAKERSCESMKGFIIKWTADGYICTFKHLVVAENLDRAKALWDEYASTELAHSEKRAWEKALNAQKRHYGGFVSWEDADPENREKGCYRLERDKHGAGTDHRYD